MGPGRYVKNIIQHLEKIDHENQYVIFLTREGFDQYQAQNPNFKKALSNYTWYSFSEQTFFLFSVLKQKLDLFYVPHFNIPILYPGKLVTAIPDMTMHTTSEAATTRARAHFQLKKFVYRMVFWWAIFRSYKVIVPSKSTMGDFEKYIKGIPTKKYVLAYEGLDPDCLKVSENPEAVPSKYRIKKPFILHVGSMYEHKNINGLLEMFKILKSEYGFEGQMVLVSKKDKFSERMLRQIQRCDLAKDIILPAYQFFSDKDIVVTDEEVGALRKMAQCYVFASFKEGFSLTALEGMALGLPAVLSDIECHREIYGDSVLYFDPKDPKDMAQKVSLMLKDKNLKDEYIRKGYELVKKYDWLNTAGITLKVFQEALK